MAFTLFLWWGLLSALGAAGWLLLLALGWREPPSLAAWARPMALLALSWGVWLLGQLIAVPVALALVTGVLLLAGACVGWCRWARVRATLAEHWRALLWGEALFALTAAWTVWMRGRAPGIAHTEQPMDMAFLASCAHATQLPPADPWLAGEPVSYYYLGYLLWGLMARVTGTAPTAAYNLALAATAGLATQALYGLLWWLLASETRLQGAARCRWAALGAMAIMATGNLVLLAESLRAVGVLSSNAARWLGVPGLAEAPVTGRLIPEGNAWWRASRPWLDTALPGHNGTIIAEFPAFSLALGDLHPHWMALPFAVSVAGLALSAGVERGRWLRVAVAGWACGAVALVNGWELPTLLALLILGQLWSARIGRSSWRSTLALSGLGVAAALLPHLSFWLTLDSQMSGLRVAWFAKTPLRSYLLVFGSWLLPLSVWLWRERHVARRVGRWWLFWLLLPVLAVAVVGGVGRLVLSVVSLARGAALGLLLSLGLAIVAARLWTRPADYHAETLLLVFIGLGLCYAVEAFFLGDLFGSRMNTVFKFYAQAWWLLGAGAVVAITSLLHGASGPEGGAGWPRAVAGVTFALWVCLAGYPLLTIPEKGFAWSLDALAAESPATAEAVGWLREHARAQDVLLTASGVDYDPASSRLATLSGVPTVLGWPQHERQWGRDAALIEERERDIATAYRSADAQERGAILRRYAVTWVWLGPAEQAQYGEGALAPGRWAPWCTLAWARDGQQLWHCRP